jgi:hypothetical protein
VPELVAVDAAQPVNFVNRDDVTHRIVKVSGPGRTFRSEPLEPGERYRLSLIGKPVRGSERDTDSWSTGWRRAR